MKRIFRMTIALTAVLALLCAAVPTEASSAAGLAAESGDHAPEIISELGIYRGDAQNKDEISRIEFAAAVARMLGFESGDAPAEDPFADLLKYEYASAEAAYLKEKRIMVGDENGCFQPQAPMDAEAALVVGARALGYTYRIEAAAHPRTEALRTARNAELDRGVDSSQKTIDESVLKRLLYNILCASYMEWEEKAGAPLLTAVWGLEKVEGTVNANDITGLYHHGGACGEGRISIGQESYENRAMAGRDLIGRRVTAFVERGTDRIRYLYERDNRSVFFFDGDLTYSDFGLYRTNENGKAVRYPLDKKFAFLCNGKSAAFDKAYFSRDEAEVTLIDNNGDGVYDVAAVEHFTYDLVQSVNLTLGTVQCRFSHDSIQAETNAAVTAELYCNGARTGSLEEIRSETLIKYYQNGDFAKVQIYDAEQISGTVTGRELSGGTQKYIRINGERYTYNSCFETYFPEIELNAAGVFLLDPYGRISVFMTDTPKDEYGYVTGFHAEQSLDWKAELRMMTEKDEFAVFSFADSVRIDGESRSLSRDIDYITGLFMKDGVILRQPVIYRINAAGEIVQLDLYTVTEPGQGNTDAPKTFDRLQRYFENLDLYYTTTASGPYDRSFTINASTVIFSVPSRIKADPAGSYRDEMFRRLDYSDVISQRNYRFDVFDIGETGLAQMIVIYTDDPIPFIENAPIGVCESVMNIYDPESGMPRTGISFWYRGAFYQKFFAEDVQEFPQAGDMFQYRTDAQDQIDRIDVQYRLDGSINKMKMSYSGIRVVEPSRVIGSYLCGVTNGTAYSYYDLSNTQVAVYHTNSGVLESGTIQDIEAGKSTCVLSLIDFNAISCVIYQ